MDPRHAKWGDRSGIAVASLALAELASGALRKFSRRHEVIAVRRGGRRAGGARPARRAPAGAARRREVGEHAEEPGDAASPHGEEDGGDESGWCRTARRPNRAGSRATRRTAAASGACTRERIAGARAGDQQEVLEELEQRGGARRRRVSGSEETVRDAHQRESAVGGRAGPRIEPPDIGGVSTSGRRAAEDCTTFFAVGEKHKRTRRREMRP